MLLHDTGMPADDEGSGTAGAVETADTILSRLRFDNKSRGRILEIIRYLGMRIEPERNAVARAVLKVGRDVFEDLLKAKRAHITATRAHIAAKRAHITASKEHIAASGYHKADGRNTTEDLHQLEMTEAVFRLLIESGDCLSLKELDINGDDLKRLGFVEGSEIGEVLGHLLDRVIDEPELNNKELLKKMALEYLDN